jgi:hypothetical protein
MMPCENLQLYDTSVLFSQHSACIKRIPAGKPAGFLCVVFRAELGKSRICAAYSIASAETKSSLHACASFHILYFV